MRLADGAKGINTNAFLNFYHPLDAYLPPVEIMQPFLEGGDLNCAEELHVLNLFLQVFISDTSN